MLLQSRFKGFNWIAASFYVCFSYKVIIFRMLGIHIAWVVWFGMAYAWVNDDRIFFKHEIMYLWSKYVCVIFVTEWATYLGQRVFFVVFPQIDPIEEAEWTDRSSFTSKASGPLWIVYYFNLAALHLKCTIPRLVVVVKKKWNHNRLICLNGDYICMLQWV